MSECDDNVRPAASFTGRARRFSSTCCKTHDSSFIGGYQSERVPPSPASDDDRSFVAMVPATRLTYNPRHRGPIRRASTSMLHNNNHSKLPTSDNGGPTNNKQASRRAGSSSSLKGDTDTHREDCLKKNPAGKYYQQKPPPLRRTKITARSIITGAPAADDDPPATDVRSSCHHGDSQMSLRIRTRRPSESSNGHAVNMLSPSNGCDSSLMMCHRGFSSSSASWSALRPPVSKTESPASDSSRAAGNEYITVVAGNFTTKTTATPPNNKVKYVSQDSNVASGSHPPPPRKDNGARPLGPSYRRRRSSWASLESASSPWLDGNCDAAETDEKFSNRSVDATGGGTGNSHTTPGWEHETLALTSSPEFPPSQIGIEVVPSPPIVTPRTLCQDHDKKIDLPASDDVTEEKSEAANVSTSSLVANQIRRRPLLITPSSMTEDSPRIRAVPAISDFGIPRQRSTRLARSELILQSKKSPGIIMPAAPIGVTSVTSSSWSSSSTVTNNNRHRRRSAITDDSGNSSFKNSGDEIGHGPRLRARHPRRSVTFINADTSASDGSARRDGDTVAVPRVRPPKKSASAFTLTGRPQPPGTVTAGDHDISEAAYEITEEFEAGVEDPRRAIAELESVWDKMFNGSKQSWEEQAETMARTEEEKQRQSDEKAVKAKLMEMTKRLREAEKLEQQEKILEKEREHNSIKNMPGRLLERLRRWKSLSSVMLPAPSLDHNENVENATRDAKIERRLEAVFVSYALYGKWDRDQAAMWLPHDCRGITLGNFLVLARDTKLATDGILSAHARSVFFEYINTKTGIMEFPSFVEAISELALRCNKQSYRGVTSVLRLNKEGLMLVRPLRDALMSDPSKIDDV